MNMAVQKGICDPPGTLLQRCARHWWHMWLGLLLGSREYIISCIGWPYVRIEEIEKRTNRIAVLTGGTRGIGLGVLKMLLQLDYTVILGVRNIPGSEEILKKIRSGGITTGKVKFFQLDLKSLSSVKKFAEEVISSEEGQKIHLLINNAGISQPVYEVTEDCYEAHFQVNYLSHFLLTRKLLPRIKHTALEAGKDSEPCFIVNTSSFLHGGGHIDLNEWETCQIFCPHKAYFDSKLCQILHVQTLEKMFKSEGLNIHAYASNPGAIPTDMWTDTGGSLQTFKGLLTYISRTTEDSAYAVLHPILKAPNWDKAGGKYLSKGRPAKPNSQAGNEEIENGVWAKSLKLTENM